MIGKSEAAEETTGLTADSVIVEHEDGHFQIGLCDDAPFADRRSGCSPKGGSPPASAGAALSGAVIIAQLIGNDTAQAGDVVVCSRSPVFELCRALLAAGANPNSRLECFRGSILALTVSTIGIGAKLTIRETATDGPRVVRWKALQDRDVSAPVRQNGVPVG